MFKTSQPNPESKGPRKSSDSTCSDSNAHEAKPEFESLEDFAFWLDLQLSALESSQEDFLTRKSVRNFLSRD